jgi:hypothetical protein
MTIDQVNKWQGIIRSYKKQPINYEDMVAKSNKEGLTELVVFLRNNHYIAKMADGNTFINWSSNKYYPEATIVALKAELMNGSREPTLEERVAILEEQMKQLLGRVKV